MAGVIKTSIRTILDAVRAEVVSFTRLPKVRVLDIAPSDGKVPDFQGDRVVFLWPRRFLSVREAQDGAGRIAKKVRRYLDVIPRVRRQTDAGNTQRLWLNDARGYFALEEQLIDCLEMFAPEDADGNWLLYEPMRILEGAEPSKDMKDKTGWGDGSLRFEMSYLLNVDLTRAL